MRTRIYETARLNIGDNSWAKASRRIARRNKNVVFKEGEDKSNLFIYEVLYAAGADIGTPNMANPIKNADLSPCFLSRPPSAKDWFDEKVKNVILVGEGNPRNIKWEEGDVITDGDHIGIVTRCGKTINAGENEIVENDWGFNDKSKTFKIFRPY